jgi:rod shape-determining protein MreC
MNKELIPTLVLIFALFGGAYYYSETVQAPFLSLLHTIKSTYHDSVKSVSDAINEHFAQQETIREQRERIGLLEKRQLEMQQLKTDNEAFLKLNDSPLAMNPSVTLVRTLSYVKFGDTRKVWLEMPDFNTSKVYGLVYNDMAAGIVVASRNKPMALLNGDPKSSYAVFVGKNRAPGIVHGNNTDTLIVRYIPTWLTVEPGDEVVTSGLDQLFFRGLRVGKVLSVTLSEGYQSAVISPYHLAENPAYFHVITKLH